jgi:hypothetical protein
LNYFFNKNNNQEHIAVEGENIQLTEGPTMEKMDPPTFDELESAIKKLKNNKTPGADGITAELFKLGGTELKNRMFQLISIFEQMKSNHMSGISG